MIKVYKFVKGGVIEGSVSNLGSSLKCWTHCLNPTLKELKEICEKSNIPYDTLKETIDPEERPKIVELENYSWIVVRTPWIKHNEIRTTPISIFISKNKNNVITIATKEVSPIQKIKELVNTNSLDLTKNSMSFFIYRLLDEVFSSYFVILEMIEEKIDHIEDVVVKRPEKITLQNILSVKKTLIFFHKALSANKEVISSIEKEYVPHIDKKNIRRFKILHDDVNQLVDMEGTYREILTGTLDIYITSISNNLNQVMKTLTIIASFTLVPTLISGIYGMNFNINSPWNLPELSWQYGYFFALGLMFISMLITFIYFKKRHWM